MNFRAKRAASACLVLLAALLMAAMPTASSQIPMRGLNNDLANTADRFLSLDLNGDGKADMLYYRPGGGYAGAYLSHGDGTFRYVTYVNGGTGYNGFPGDLANPQDAFVALDLNGDGKDDFIQYRPGSGFTIRCLSNGDGTLNCSNLSTPGSESFGFADSMTNSNTRIVAMKQGHGASEFLVYTPGGGSAAIYVPQASSANLTNINLTANSVANTMTGWQENMNASDTKIVPLDVNGDGYPDLLVYSAQAGTVRLYINNQHNGFTMSPLAAPGRNMNGFTGNSQDSNAHAIALDLNGDGKQDILWWQAGSGTVIGFLSNGNGTVMAVNYLTNGTSANGFIDTDSYSVDTAVALNPGTGQSNFLWYSPGNSVVTGYTPDSNGHLTANSFRTNTGVARNFQSSTSTQYDSAVPLNFLGTGGYSFAWYVPGSGVFQAYSPDTNFAGYLKPYNFYAYPGTFLSDLSWSIGSLPVKEVVMPGTHDAAMYGLNLGIADPSETQWGDIPYQLANGARFFDFRMGYYVYVVGAPYDVNGTFALIDTPNAAESDAFLMYGHSTILTDYLPGDLINQIESWLVDNPNEVVFLDFSDQAFVGSQRDMTTQFAQLLANTKHPDLIYTQQAACGSAHCTNPAVQPQNMSINQYKASGSGYYGSRLVLINTPDALTKLGWGWQGTLSTEVGYCNDGSGRSSASAELDCINKPNTSVSGSQSLEQARPSFEAADAASQFMHLQAQLTPFGYNGFIPNSDSPLHLADGYGGSNTGFNNGTDISDLNVQLAEGAWNANALNIVTFDGIGHDDIAKLVIQRNRQTWVNTNFFNNNFAQPAGALGVGVNGDVWAAGSGHSISIFKYVNGAWKDMINSQPNVKKLAVDPQGGVWVVDGSQGRSSLFGSLIHYDANGQNENVTGSVVQDVAVGRNGSVWAMGLDGSIFEASGPTDGSPDIKSSVPTQYGSHVAVDNMGHPWVLDNNGYIQKFNGSSWQQVSGSQGKEIVAGADGSIFITGYNTPSIGRYNVQNNNFDFFHMDAAHIAVDGGGQPWAIRQITGAVYKGSLDQM